MIYMKISGHIPEVFPGRGDYNELHGEGREHSCWDTLRGPSQTGQWTTRSSQSQGPFYRQV